MKSQPLFNLQENIDCWIDAVKVEPSITEVDIEELRSHLLDLIDNLKVIGLDDEEAFLVASKRLWISDDVASLYRQENNHILQMKRSIIILGGVLVFFLCYYFILASSKIIFILLFHVSDSNPYLAMNWLSRILIGWHFIFLIVFTGMYFLENKTARFIEKIQIKPRHTFILVSLSFIFGIIEFEAVATIRKLLNDNFYIIGKISHSDIYFDISFPLLICVGFIFVFYKYYRKTKI